MSFVRWKILIKVILCPKYRFKKRWNFHNKRKKRANDRRKHENRKNYSWIFNFFRFEPFLNVFVNISSFFKPVSCVYFAVVCAIKTNRFAEHFHAVTFPSVPSKQTKLQFYDAFGIFLHFFCWRWWCKQISFDFLCLFQIAQWVIKIAGRRIESYCLQFAWNFQLNLIEEWNFYKTFDGFVHMHELRMFVGSSRNKFVTSWTWSWMNLLVVAWSTSSALCIHNS